VRRRIEAVTVSKHPLRRPWSADWTGGLIRQRVKEVQRRGKWIILALGGGSSLVIHLGMTGQLTVVPTDEPVSKHTHLVFRLSPGRSELRFRDIRRFGSATLLPDTTALEDFFRKTDLGPEPFELASRDWRERLAATRRCLKAVLLDQRVVAGVGNIYADESLFQAALHPAKLANELTGREADRVRRAIAAVLDRAIDRRGSSIRNYVGGSGLKGRYQEEFRVYQRAGRPCPRCGKTIERIRLAGRSTHFCPGCQPSPDGILA
jgi:formamidopyrimidine-DNA glycosylase